MMASRFIPGIEQRLQWAEQSAATLLLLSAALFNGYPLVFSDTGTYIFSGFEWKVPVDRPISYGLFLHASSLGFSLWLPVMIQCFVLAWLIRMFWRTFFPAPGFSWPLITLTGVLCALTPLPWYSGELMPDVFTEVLLLITGVVLLRAAMPRRHWIVLGLLFVFCSVSHFSNLFIGVAALAGVAVLRSSGVDALRGLPHFRKRAVIILLWCGAAFIAMPAINWMVAKEWTMGKGSYTFLIGRLLDNGVLKRYLDENCGRENFRLCQYRDSLPANSRNFHWDADSPLAKEGGWGVPEPEYKKIVWNTLTTPKYLALHIWESLLSTPSQLLQNSVGSGLELGWYRSPESPPYQAVAKYYPYELNEYRFSRQCGNLWGQGLDFKFYSTLFFWAMLLSACMLPGLLFLNKTQGFFPEGLEAGCYILLCGMVSNAFITSSLASICDRFQSRVAWFLPFAVCLMLWAYARKRFTPAG
ncbi:MAG: hypothetical protein KA165_03760 [Saprospiraceae bacterium]|nr:hypothetical protein [Saprospiraceae bacterium]